MTFFCTFVLILLGIGAAAGALILGGWSGAAWGAGAAFLSLVAAIAIMGRPPK